MTARTLVTLLALAAPCGCFNAAEAPAPETYVAPEPVPARPTDTARPLDAVVWTMGYDLREFDRVWAWLHDAVPTGPERARAIGAAAMLGVAELDRDELGAEGVAAFADAIRAFPDDDRLPMWHAYLRFAVALRARDRDGLRAALDALRAAAARYPEFNLVGLTLSIGGYEDASPELVAEARAAFDALMHATAALQRATDRRSIERSRRIFDSPIAPYGIPALQAMIGDTALRAGDTRAAQVAYYTATRVNAAHRWPWREEVERRAADVAGTAAGFAARPATTWSFGARGLGAMGVRERVVDARFGGRVGNGTCTVCHTHVSVFDAPGGTAPPVGWIRARFAPVAGVPNALPTAFALPAGENAIPAGFAVGPSVPVDAPREFFTDDARFDGTFVIPAPAGRYFVALRAAVDGRTYQGYSAREAGQQWFVDVRPGRVTDISADRIHLTPMTP